MKTVFAGVVMGVLVLGAGAPARAAGSGPAAPGTVFVTNLNTNTVTAIDPVTHAVRTVGGFNGPLGIAITPDGRTALVTNSLGNTVTPIDLTGGGLRLGAPIRGGGAPAAVAISTSGTIAYVSNFNSNSVTPINLRTRPPTPGAPFKVGSGPWSLALSPNGRTLVVSDSEGNSVTVVDLASRAKTTVALSSRPQAVAVAPDGATAYVAVANGVVPIALSAGHAAAGALIAVSAGPVGVAVTPDGRTAYTANNDNTLTPINLAARPPRPGTPVAVGTLSQPDGVAVSPDGATAYAANASSTVTPINLRTATPEAPIGVGSATFGIAIAPDQAPVARLSVTPGRAGQPSTFTAAGSTSADGGVSRYAWNFGDGATSLTSAPTTTHAYAAGGTYHASVTETSRLGTSVDTTYTGQTMSNHGSPSAAAGALVRISGALQTIPASGPPGLRVDLRDTTVTTTCSPIDVFFDGRLVSQTTLQGHLVNDRSLVIPGNASVGLHHLELGCTATGATFVSTNFTVVATKNHLSEFSVAMPTFGQLKHNIVASGGIGLGMLLISRLISAGFPSEWLDSTYEANRHRLQARMRRRFPSLFTRRGTPRPVAQRVARGSGLFLVFILAAGAINSVLDPGFGLNRTTLWLFLGQAIGVGIVTMASQLPVAVGGLRDRREIHLQILLGGMVIAIVCVAASRAIGLSPGYCYGLIAVFVLHPKVREEEWGRLHALASVVVLVVSTAALFLTIPVFHAATSAHPSPLLLILVPALNVIFIGGFSSLAFGMFPLPFLPGYHVKRWNYPAWLVISFAGLLGFLAVLLAPGSGSHAELHHVAIIPLVVAFALFSLASLGAIVYFHRHPSAVHEDGSAHETPPEAVPGADGAVEGLT
ncbi:MAG: FGLLP motif-containing membrane protein [Acidimicrobiales bacterium]